MTYSVEYTPLFEKNLKRYPSLRRQIRQKIQRILASPYQNTERLGRVPGGLDLRGCRSARVTQNFRILFVICEECRRVPQCRYCFCEGLADQTVVFLTVGPHARAYALREEPAQYMVTGPPGPPPQSANPADPLS